MDGEKGEKGGWRRWKREIIYLSLYCHHQNDSCINETGSDESHFTVSSVVRKPQPQLKRNWGEPKQNRTAEVLLLGWVLLYVHRNRRLIRTGAQDVHLDFHTAPELCPSAYQPNALLQAKRLCCLMSSDVGWHIRDKLRPMPKHSSILFYVHGNHQAR